MISFLLSVVDITLIVCWFSWSCILCMLVVCDGNWCLQPCV